MCFSEFSEERGVSHPIQFFASDIDEAAIDKARQGLYPDTIAQDVSPERIRRFFVKTEQGYQVNKPNCAYSPGRTLSRTRRSQRWTSSAAGT
jgi:two-component system CheB/CheR fusion protein